MSATDVFFDSNVLIHLFSADLAKADHAELLLVAGGTVSVQVLNEVASIALRKARLEFPAIRDILGSSGRPARSGRWMRRPTGWDWTSRSDTGSRSATA